MDEMGNGSPPRRDGDRGQRQAGDGDSSEELTSERELRLVEEQLHI